MTTLAELYLAQMLCTCGEEECVESTRVTPNLDSPGPGPMIEATMTPTDRAPTSPLRHIPRPLMDAIDTALCSAWQAGQYDGAKDPRAASYAHSSATFESEMWEALADYLMRVTP